MVNQLGAIAVAASISCYAFPAAGQERTVKRVVMEETGLNIDTEDAFLTEHCKSFKPTASQVKRYFSRAYPVDGYIHTHERYSPCYATGEVKFSDNSSGTFQLSSGGAALLTWSKSQDTVRLLYKRNPWYDPFACMYGLSEKLDC